MKAGATLVAFCALLMSSSLSGLTFGTLISSKRNPFSSHRASMEHDFQQSVDNSEISVSVHMCSLPPTGATYSKSMKFPVIGRQSFQLHFLTRRTARLIINGMLSMDEIINYSVQPETGKFTFALSKTTKHVLRRYRTKLGDVGYHAETDTPFVDIFPPLAMKVRLHLCRQHASQ